MIKAIPPPGVVDLCHKLEPVCSLEVPPDFPLAVTRAEVDVSALKEKLLSLPPEMWEDEHQSGNVRLTRPAHDKWGIKKIVFTFCDDFLLKVLDLPWSLQESWKTLLDPIYEAIGVDKKKIVRSLLASMPPGCVIPVHHDTGHWVKHTHRIHVPIITGDGLEFLVGPNDQSMVSYMFNEGRIVEINNQAKHAVTNNLPFNRVHLIFDYVEDYPITRYTLQPGQVLHQTRRSIDFDGQEDTTPVHPAFIILGAQKCGTTSLYEYICQHPLVVRGKRRETHYFDWRWNKDLTKPEEQLKYYMNFYHAEALHKHRTIITGESTPSYLLHSDIVIPRVKSVLPFSDIKFFVMLRNPAARAYSQFQMAVDTSGTAEQLKVRGMSSYTGKSFAEVVNKEIEELTNLGITPDCSYETFRDKVLPSLPMNHGGHSIIARYVLGGATCSICNLYICNRVMPYVQWTLCTTDSAMVREFSRSNYGDVD